MRCHCFGSHAMSWHSGPLWITFNYFKWPCSFYPPNTTILPDCKMLLPQMKPWRLCSTMSNDARDSGDGDGGDEPGAATMTSLATDGCNNKNKKN
jgi:hypothetical protein